LKGPERDARVVPEGKPSMAEAAADDRPEKEAPGAADPVRALLDATGDAFCIYDAETARILEANGKLLELFDCAREELDRLQPGEALPEGEGSAAERTLRLVRLAAAGQTQRVEWATRKRTGEGLRLEAQLCRVELGGQVRVLALVRDISARVAAEDRLRVRERDLRNLIENVPGLVYRCEVDPPWRMLYMSEGVQAVAGRPAEAFVSGDIPFADIVLAEDLPALVRRTAEGVERREPYQVEFRIRLPDGALRWVFARAQATYDPDGKPVFLDGVILDITDRKSAEATGRQARELYRLIAENASDMISVHDEMGIYLYASPSSARLIGYAPEELAGRSAFDFIHPDDQASIERHRADTVSGHVQHAVRYRLLAKNGSWVWVETLSRPLPRTETDPANRILAATRDIGERVQAEEALRESEEQYRTLYAVMDEGFVLHQLVRDANRTVVDYRILDANPSFTRLTEIERERAVGRLATEVYGVTPAPFLELYARVCESGHPEWFEAYFEPLKKHFSISVFSPHPDIFATVFYDITARKKAEHEAREERLRAQQYLDIAAVVLVALDREGRVTLINRCGLELLGYAREELLGQDWFGRCLSEKVREGERRAFAERMAGRSAPTTHYEGVVVARDGRERRIAWRSVLLHDNEGRVVGTLSSGEDVTEHRKVEERLRQTEKMSAIGQLAGGVAHDFNNQLAAIQGYADLLHSRLDDPVLKRYTESILVASRRSADLTRQLLAFARKGQYRSLVVDLHEIVHEVVGILERSIDKRIRIRQHLDASPSTVLGDPSQLQNALLNLGLNARDAMPDGGDLVIATDVRDLDVAFARESPYEVVPGKYLQIRVTDTGIGMSREVQEHLFEPFFTTKEQGKGTGMGLAAVYGTVKNHHGFIEVSSRLGQGTTVELFIPLHEAPAEREERGAVSAIPAHRTARILVVDDEAMIRDLAAEMLRALGHQVATCQDGEEAIAYYRQHWRQTDLVILDMVMPGRSGRDTFLDLRRINPAIQALLSSGFSVDGEAQKILDEGVRGFLQKPYTFKDLSTKVGELLVGS